MKMFKTILTTVIALVSFNTFAVPITASSSSDFIISYDGISGDPVATITGLSATVRYYDFAFIDSAVGQTNVTFKLGVTNTSVAPVTSSRVSGLAFNTDKTFLSTGSTILGVYDQVSTTNGNYPNGLGPVDFCFSDQNCQGGGSGGVEMGSGTVIGTASLYFLGDFTSMQFDDFFIRYQSLNCDPACYKGASSASGTGSTIVPEPSIVGLLAIGLLGLASARRSMKA